MDLKKYMRTIINHRIRPLFIKEECEICSTIKNLHLHHINLFSRLLDETLKDLQLVLKNTKDYSGSELSLITNVLLGKHIQDAYLTLCEKCHLDEHFDDWKEITNNNAYYKKRRKLEELKRKARISDKVIPYLDVIKGERLIGEQKEELINVLNVRRDGRQQKSISKLNEYMIENSIPFVIKSEKGRELVRGVSKCIRYWKLYD